MKRIITYTLAAGMAGVSIIPGREKYDQSHLHQDNAPESEPAAIRVNGYLGASTATVTSVGYLFMPPAD